MYAVIRSGGKQHIVRAGDVLRLEKLPQDVGATVELADVLLIADGDKVTVGSPTVAGAKVTATIVAQDRADKIRVFKKKRRKRFQKTIGHRQHITVVQVGIITAG